MTRRSRLLLEIRGAGKRATFEGAIATGELYRVPAAFREGAP